MADPLLDDFSSPTAAEEVMCRQRIAKSWTPQSPKSPAQPAPRFGHTAVIDGNAMIIFGGRDQNIIGDVWRYAFDSQEWTCLSEPPTTGAASTTSTAPLSTTAAVPSTTSTAASSTSTTTTSRQPPPARCGHTAVVSPDHQMIVFGGLKSRAECSNDVWSFDLGRNTWQLLAPRSAASSTTATATEITDEGEVVLSAATPGTLSTSTTEPRECPMPRKGHTATLVNKGMLVFGGCADNRVWRFDMLTQSWSVIAVIGDAPQCRQYHIAEALDDRRILIFGGQSTADPSVFFNDISELDTVTGEWKQLEARGEAPSGRMCSASASRNGVVCVLAGGSSVFHNECYEFDVKRRMWRTVQNSPMAVTRPTAVQVGNEIVMFGGCSEGQFRNVLYTLSFKPASLKELCRQWLVDAGPDAKDIIVLPDALQGLLQETP